MHHGGPTASSPSGHSADDQICVEDVDMTMMALRTLVSVCNGMVRYGTVMLCYVMFP